MNYFDMNCFVVLATLKNYNKASDFLFISQPALSKKIQNLEKELSVNLFDRKGIQIELNKNGEMFLDYCNNALNEFKKFNKKLENISENAVHTLNIILICNLPFFENFLFDFYKEYKNIKISIFQHNQDRLGLYDWDLKIFASTKKSFEESNLLYEESIKLAMSKDCKLASKDNISLKDIKDYNLLLMPDTTWINAQLSDIFEKNSFFPKSNFYCDNYLIIERLCEKNQGITFFPSKSFEYGKNPNLIIKDVKGVDSGYKKICAYKKQ